MPKWVILSCAIAFIVGWVNGPEITSFLADFFTMLASKPE